MNHQALQNPSLLWVCVSVGGILLLLLCVCLCFLVFSKENVWSDLDWFFVCLLNLICSVFLYFLFLKVENETVYSKLRWYMVLKSSKKVLIKISLYSGNVYIILKCFNFYVLFYVNDHFPAGYYLTLGVRGEIIKQFAPLGRSHYKVLIVSFILYLA